MFLLGTEPFIHVANFRDANKIQKLLMWLIEQAVTQMLQQLCLLTEFQFEQGNISCAYDTTIYLFVSVHARMHTHTLDR